MWLGKQRAEWDRAASLTVQQLQLWTPERLDHTRLIPALFRTETVKPRKTLEEIEGESKLGWKLWKQSLKSK